ncbi:transcriptional regulator, TetR family [Xylanimonas cellulosilytica DSM 15894]|uniref:Transcriptional regulator, TetR family n=1 Tax=Xylanimonas cellulosilytica (strain DSM 15894 / JCM 12276 / CECT 5975 / KCTC 9989 / LMG 20990 / NBRC 107835 / XIL07) TaxID=446471 RepID=D1BYD4_XYLCX|nr:TetR/AcrR family transcriptional regulator [Xylanimonas cellulosilytica]ACZ31806.1 transcriptional regulator, TetR family [Xylanimonas cellulosilytica DSM 15894]
MSAAGGKGTAHGDTNATTSCYSSRVQDMAEEGSAREPARRPGGRTARVRRRVLEAAAELIARDGIGGMRYDQVAELAGVNRTSVYRNWPDRTVLVADALATVGADAAPLHDSGDLEADLVDYLEALAAATASLQGRALLNVVASARENPELRAAVDKVFDRRLATLQDRLQAAVDRGELPAIDFSLLGEMLAGPVQLFVNRGARPFTRADAQRVSSIVLAGVRATAAHGDAPVDDDRDVEEVRRAGPP